MLALLDVSFGQQDRCFSRMVVWRHLPHTAFGPTCLAAALVNNMHAFELAALTAVVPQVQHKPSTPVSSPQALFTACAASGARQALLETQRRQRPSEAEARLRLLQ